MYKLLLANLSKGQLCQSIEFIRNSSDSEFCYDGVQWGVPVDQATRFDLVT